MEFTNEIFFNKPLTAGSTVIITYSGKLYREHSKDVSIVFGYGDDWAETDNSPMIETDNGFEVTLTIKDYKTFNFCFTNSFNIWDNNFGFNYISPIAEKQETNIEESTVEQVVNIEQEQNTEENKQEEQIIEEKNEVSTSTDTLAIKKTNDSNDNNDNDNTPKADGLGNSNEESSSTSSTSAEESTESEETAQSEESTEPSTDNSEKFENVEQNEDIETAFSSLLDSLLNNQNNNNETIDISNLSGFGLQSIDDIKEEEMINCDDIFAELFDELTLDKKENVSQVEQIESESNTQIQTESENTTLRENEITDYDKYDAQELDSLMDNLLSSISSKGSSSDSDYATPIQTIESQDLSNENVGLPATLETEDWVDKIINASYNFSKKVSTVFKKFGNLLKIKAKELGIINGK